MTCGICATIFCLFIGKISNTDNFEMTKVFYMLDHLLTNTNYTA